MGIPAYWGELAPPLQNSVYGGAVLPNQFEPLVRRGANGLIEPLAAKSWTISRDRKVLRFLIDTERRFSDGSRLSAADFKRSWEDGLRMRARASNRSVEDALYNVEGFGDLRAKGTIAGIRALGDSVLELDFKEPVRIPLGYLSGVRYAAYKEVRGRFIGTGPYVIRERGKSLDLAPNPYYKEASPAFARIIIRAFTPQAMPKALEDGSIDGAIFADKADFRGCDSGSGRIRCLYSQEADHVLVRVNGLPGRLFSNPRYRLALQALIHERLPRAALPGPLRTGHFLADPQSLLPFQPGRLSASEAGRLADAGRRYIPALVAASRKRPVYLVSGADCAWLIGLLRDAGVTVDRRSGQEDFKKVLDVIFRTHAADLTYGTSSVYNSDPDGLYHVLGRRGALFSTMTDRRRVSDLMESGRRITDAKLVAPHYEAAARAILEDVPYVHLGFDYRAVAYDSRKVSVAQDFVSRNDLRVSLFQPR